MAKKDETNPVEELRKTLFGYLQQEISRSVKSLLSWAALGLLGSIFIAAGFVFITIGSIRLLQAETGSIFEGSFSWAPYFIAIAGLILLSSLSFMLLREKKREK